MSETTTAISRDHSQRRYQKRPFGDELGGVIRAKQELTLQFDQLCCGEHTQPMSRPKNKHSSTSSWRLARVAQQTATDDLGTAA